MALDYFVPTYGHPGNSLTTEDLFQLETLIENIMQDREKPKALFQHYLSGNSQALADYRTLLASDNTEIQPYLHHFSESSIGDPIEQFIFEGRCFSRSSLNYLLGLSFLKKHLEGFIPRIILEIGGGFGTLGEIFASSQVEGFKYIDVDIPPMHYIAQYYLEGISSKNNVQTAFQTLNLDAIEIENLPIFTTLCSWQIESLIGNVDLFVNFISFQEMEPGVVANYLQNIQRLKCKWVLLRNMREGKQISKVGAAGVREPILSDYYINVLSENYNLVGRNVLPFGYETIDGFSSELLLFKSKV